MAFEPRGGPAPFQVTELSLGKVAGVAVRGEVEIVTTPRLTAAIDERIRHSAGPFVLDLCDVEFLDSSGIACLVRAIAMLGRDDRPLAVVCPDGPVRRVITLSGIDHQVVLYDTREELERSLERGD
jgi:anti-sigma B factor antagonist